MKSEGVLKHYDLNQKKEEEMKVENKDNLIKFRIKDCKDLPKIYRPFAGKVRVGTKVDDNCFSFEFTASNGLREVNQRYIIPAMFVDLL